MALKLLTTCDSVLSANLLKTKLESEGIYCFLNHENFSNLMPHFYNMLGSGVQVMVSSDQLEQAQRIAQLDDGKLKCPNCSSTNIANDSERKAGKLKLIAIAFLFVIPIGNLLNNYVCKECGHQFKK